MEGGGQEVGAGRADGSRLQMAVGDSRHVRRCTDAGESSDADLMGRRRVTSPAARPEEEPAGS